MSGCLRRGRSTYKSRHKQNDSSASTVTYTARLVQSTSRVNFEPFGVGTSPVPPELVLCSGSFEWRANSSRRTLRFMSAEPGNDAEEKCDAWEGDCGEVGDELSKMKCEDESMVTAPSVILIGRKGWRQFKPRAHVIMTVTDSGIEDELNMRFNTCLNVCSSSAANTSSNSSTSSSAT